MKTAIPSKGTDLDSAVDERFGRANRYLISDLESGDFKAVDNPAADANRGAGVAAAQIISDQDVSSVVVDFIGPNSFQAFQNTGIKVYQADSEKNVKENLDLLKKGKLKLLQAPTGPPGRRGKGPRGGSGQSRGRQEGR